MKHNITMRHEKKQIVHYHNKNNLIYSRINRVCGHFGPNKFSVDIPLNPLLSLCGRFKLTRRLLRLDRINICVSKTFKHALIIYQRNVYKLTFSTQEVYFITRLPHTRNVLSQGILAHDDGNFSFGQYYQNKQREPVKIWKTTDKASKLITAYTFPKHSIRHIHGIFLDPFTQSYCVTTGDLDGECFIYVFNFQWKLLKQLGDGSQKWRAVTPIFRKNTIHWVMDSPYETAHAVIMDRASESIKLGAEFPGPGLFMKDLSDNATLATTSHERGAACKTKGAHIFISRDMEHWHEIAFFPKDILPQRFFRFGSISFADGEENSSDFYIYGESLKGLDATSIRVSISNITRVK